MKLNKNGNEMHKSFGQREIVFTMQVNEVIYVSVEH